MSEVYSMLLGKLFTDKVKAAQEKELLENVEFKVFSQHGEDGIIQYIINKIEIPNKTFVEFGVETYTESNTKFLLQNNNWSGLIIDGSPQYIEYIKQQNLYWKYELTAVSSFITKDNINQILTSNNIQGDIGLLSIDVDGNDYWIWEAISVIQPRVVICEYNSVFGNSHAISIPYKSDFFRTKAHYSNLYFGCSIPALCHLAKNKGYDFIGCTSAGNDAFFIRKDLSSPFKVLDSKDGYVESKFRESRDIKGKLTFISGKNRIKQIEHMMVCDVTNNQVLPIKECKSIGTQKPNELLYCFSTTS